MSSTNLAILFPSLPLDSVTATDSTAHRALCSIGEGFIGTLLRNEFQPLRDAHREGVDPFFAALDQCLDTFASGREGATGGADDGSLRSVIGRACVTLAHGGEHRLYDHLIAHVRYRLGWHVLRRPPLVRALVADTKFGTIFEKSLNRLQGVANQSPAALLIEGPNPEAGPGVMQCAYCDRRWSGNMPQLQELPSEIELVEDWDPSTSSRDAMIDLGSGIYRLLLDGDTPLQNACCHDHVIQRLLDGRCGVFDPWRNTLAVGFQPPEEQLPLVVGWRRY